jgi:hypothetical protein
MPSIGGLDLPPYVPSWLNQIYTWGIFAGVLLVSWDTSLTRCVSMLNDQGESAYQPGVARVLRRPYMLALALYAVVATWFTIAFLMLGIFCVCALLLLTAPLCKPFWETYIVRKLFVPDVVFNCIDLMHAPFHGVAALGTLFAASIAVGFYITDDDLVREHHAHSKTVRALFIPPAVTSLCYALYALFCVFSAATPRVPGEKVKDEVGAT